MIRYNIAIDGPAGAGKSTIAKKVAKELKFIYIDTGAMYRAISYYFIQQSLDIYDESVVSKECENITVHIGYQNDEQQVFLNGENITMYIRDEKVGKTASVISKYSLVRERLVSLQQELASKSNVIMDGRDIGTVVLPNAAVKIYLTASSLERANRRYKELTEKGSPCNLKEIESDIIERDYQDMNREHSPLKKAEDAIFIDSSHMSIDEVVNEIIVLIKKKIY